MLWLLTYLAAAERPGKCLLSRKLLQSEGDWVGVANLTTRTDSNSTWQIVVRRVLVSLGESWQVRGVLVS